MAKSAPYPPCTVTALWLKYQDPARCLRRVTQPPHIAVPLCGIRGTETDTQLNSLGNEPKFPWICPGLKIIIL
jgi:hypothetical protein